jgi:hypothetical protein
MQVRYEPWTIQKDGKEAWGVKILEGTFNELTLAINDVKLEGDDNVSVDYDIIYSLVPPSEINEDEFNQVLSFIIQDILVKAMNAHEDRMRNSAEFTQQ